MPDVRHSLKGALSILLALSLVAAFVALHNAGDAQAGKSKAPGQVKKTKDSDPTPEPEPDPEPAPAPEPEPTPEEPTTDPDPEPSGTVPSQWRRFASYESSLNGEIDGSWRADSPFQVSRTSEAGGAEGNTAVKIVTGGGNSGCSCPRMTFEDGFRYGAGSEVWISGSWRIPDPSKLSWSRLMNLGHFNSSGDPSNYYTGLVVHESGQMSFRSRYYDGRAQSVLMSNRPIPTNRWFRVDVRLKLSPNSGQALTEVYLDGQRVASSTAPNMMSSGALHFYNAGLSYFNPGTNVTVYADAMGLTPG